MDPRARFGNKNVLIKKQLAQTTFKTCHTISPPIDPSALPRLKNTQDKGYSFQLVMTIPDSCVSWFILLAMILLDIWTLRIDTIAMVYCSQ